MNTPNKPTIVKMKLITYIPTRRQVKELDERFWTARPKYESNQYGHGSSVVDSIDE